MPSILANLRAVNRRSDLDARQKHQERARLKTIALVSSAADGRVSVTAKGLNVTATVSQEGNAVRCIVDAPIPDPVLVFHNPPILVPDAAGSVIRELTDVRGNKIGERRFREDPLEALRAALRDTLEAIL